MPWKVRPVPEQRIALVHAVRTAGLPVAEAARRFGVSRKTAHKWLARFDAEPDGPLADRSRRPGRSPGRTPEDVERRRPGGPRPLGLGAPQAPRRPGPRGPARPAAADHRRHPPPPRPRRRRAAAAAGPAAQRFERGAPNELWQLDFKGPLEVERRRVVAAVGPRRPQPLPAGLRPCTDMTYATVQAVLWDLFGDVGLPEAAALRQRLLRPATAASACRPSTPG